jgi:hypothetical protein
MAEIGHSIFRNFFAPPAFKSIEALKGSSDPNEVIGSEAGGDDALPEICCDAGSADGSTGVLAGAG